MYRKAPEKGAAAIKGLFPLEFNDPGLHSPMASPRIFVLQRRVVEQLPFCISASVHQQHRRLRNIYAANMS